MTLRDFSGAAVATAFLLLSTGAVGEPPGAPAKPMPLAAPKDQCKLADDQDRWSKERMADGLLPTDDSFSPPSTGAAGATLLTNCGVALPALSG